FSTKSGNPELHSGLPCGTAPASVLHLPYPALPRCVPCSVPGHLLRPMPASRLLCPVPVTSGRTGAAAGAGNLKILKKCHFFFFYILHMLCPVPCLHFVCSF
ncbi:unnamed protein product, partial [Staurois parvus]